ncbi:dipeptidase [Sphingomonas donggukensis]|uniref:Dipeptidase n=1 Tax=Sphingomonas donggukensis TaxID=2949093 RepID=A0ABY4TU34_9SPHN|nr:dipeptidase [Sphingomonas donggukensis]URW75787.1 dipeptidase [Sphingomonas donggukensis]
MRRIIGLGAIVAALALAAFFLLAPGIVERSMNKVVPVALKTTPRSAGMAVGSVDLHADTLLWSRDLTTRATRGQVDLPRLAQGGAALQVFSSVTKTPKGQNYDRNTGDTDNITLLTVAQLQPPRTWTSLLERSLWHAEKLERAAARSDGGLRVIRSAADLDRLLADRSGTARPVGAILSVEGLQNLEGKLANVDRLHAAGFRMAGFTHFFDNDLAGSMHGVSKGGLTPFGLAVMRRMEAQGMIVDVAHASHAAVADMLRLARRAVVSSHGGVQATCRVNRNLTDEEIRGIARTGGLIGIGYWDAAVCSTSPRAIAAAIAHVRDVAGIDHVALGSDFDGAVTTGFDTTGLESIAQALLDRGFTADEVAKVMHGNALRVLRAGIQPKR